MSSSFDHLVQAMVQILKDSSLPPLCSRPRRSPRTTYHSNKLNPATHVHPLIRRIPLRKPPRFVA